MGAEKPLVEAAGSAARLVVDPRRQPAGHRRAGRRLDRCAGRAGAASADRLRARLLPDHRLPSSPGRPPWSRPTWACCSSPSRRSCWRRSSKPDRCCWSCRCSSPGAGRASAPGAGTRPPWRPRRRSAWGCSSCSIPVPPACATPPGCTPSCRCAWSSRCPLSGCGPPAARRRCASWPSLLGLVTVAGGVVMFGVELPAIQKPVPSYFLIDLDARMLQDHWNRLEPGALVFDPIPSRATTLFGRFTNSSDHLVRGQTRLEGAHPGPGRAQAARRRVQLRLLRPGLFRRFIPGEPRRPAGPLYQAVGGGERQEQRLPQAAGFEGMPIRKR